MILFIFAVEYGGKLAAFVVVMCQFLAFIANSHKVLFCKRRIKAAL